MSDGFKTPLYDKHISHGGNMISFAGYSLPIYYSSINYEHHLVRSKAGLFDVSHMGEIFISGNDAEKFLQIITVNDVSALKSGEVQYTVMCYEDGGIIDDLLLYKRESDFMLVVNAANRKKDINWLRKHSSGDVNIIDKSDDISLIAIQGPESRNILQHITSFNLNKLKFYSFINGQICSCDSIISRTGYTGELGYEIYLKNKDVNTIWTEILKAGFDYGIEPVGLACRDTLRLEMKYALYGNDIDSETNPIEAGLGWITKLNKKDFIGKSAIEKKRDNIQRTLVSIEMKELAIPRKGCTVYYNDKIIGKISSGTMSPSIGKGIAIGYIDPFYAKSGNNIDIDIRGVRKKGIIIQPPFYKTGSLHY